MKFNFFPLFRVPFPNFSDLALDEEIRCIFTKYLLDQITQLAKPFLKYPRR